MSLSILCVVLLWQNVLNVLGWGPIGHGLVARLAQSQLTPMTFNWINEYLPSDVSGNLSAIASWPDLILYPDTNPTDYKNWQWSRDLHYINIPDWSCQYISSRDCLEDKCVEGALKNYSHRLIDKNCDYIQQQQALFFLVHFVGDVHQPLHCGFEGDFGGNSVKGWFLNATNLTNLHTIWDVEIINVRINLYFQSDINLYYEYLKSLMNNQSFIVNETYNDYKTWIDESVNYVCKQVYFDDDDMKINASHHFTLGKEYFNRNWPLVDQRLAQAGRRLASLLNQLVNSRSEKTLPLDNQTLMIMIGVPLSIVIIAVLTCHLYRRSNMNQYNLLVAE